MLPRLRQLRPAMLPGLRHVMMPELPYGARARAKGIAVEN